MTNAFLRLLYQKNMSHQSLKNQKKSFKGKVTKQHKNIMPRKVGTRG